jgi:hypothetical protein
VTRWPGGTSIPTHMLTLKRSLIQQLQADLAEEIAALTRAANSAREAATHEENRPENDKDTRAVEAAYLAGAQADRVRDMERISNALEFLPLRIFGAHEPIASAALIELDLGGDAERRSPADAGKHKLHCFMAPQGGGMKVELYGKEIQVITPQSPLGQALLGKSMGDVIELRTQRGVREYEVVAVL